METTSGTRVIDRYRAELIDRYRAEIVTAAKALALEAERCLTYLPEERRERLVAMIDAVMGELE